MNDFWPLSGIQDPRTLDETFDEPKNYKSPTSSGPMTLTSPDKRSPCTRGKTMRDFEGELSELKRENFDLKMRIYIMEEQQELFQGVENIDEIYQINSSLKKEVEGLRKEVSDKDDLILKAGDAMNMLVSKHKEEVGLIRLQAQEEVENCRERMELLQQELIDLREKAFGCAQDSKLDDSSIIFSLPYSLSSVKKSFGITKRQHEEEIILELTTQLTEVDNQLKEKKLKLDEAFKTIEKLNSNIDTLKETENSLRSEIVNKGEELNILQSELAERDMDIKSLQKKISTYETTISDIAAREKAAKEEITLTDELQKIQIEKEQNNYQKLKSKYDTVREENDLLSHQVVELHKRLNDLQVELQARGAINMDLHQQLENIKLRHSDLQEETRMLRVVSDGDMECSRGRSKKLNEVMAQLEDFKNKLHRKELELNEAKNEQFNTVSVVQKLMKQNKTLTKDIENMKILLEKREQHHSNVELGRGESDASMLEELKNKLAQVEKEKDSLQTTMEQKVEKLLHLIKEKEITLQQYEKSNSCNDKERIEELEKQMANLKMELGSYLSPSESGKDFQENKKLQQELEEKKKEIEHLNEELRKRTFNLQELVNKELWNKNREIEKLNKVCEKKQSEVTNLKTQMQRQEDELGLLNAKLHELSEHISQNITKISERKEDSVSYKEKYLSETEEKNEILKEVENLKMKLNDELKKNEELIKECAKWKEEAEQHDKSRKELFNAYTSLMTRLEELATFLDSLLPLLGAKKRRMLQQVIDRSREASRSLSISVFEQSGLSSTSNLTVPILPDFSQVDFCSEDDTLDITLVQKDDIENQNAEVVQIREQVESLVEKLNEARLSPEKIIEGKSIWTIADGKTASENLKAPTVESLVLEDITEGSLLESFESDIKDETCPNVSNSRKTSAIDSIAGGDKNQEKSTAHSESEGWSEPDRNVSLARIGIREEVNTIIPSSDESSECFAKPSYSSRKRHEEIRRLNLKVKQLEKINSSLMVELRLREKIIGPVRTLTAAEVQIDGLVTKSLLIEIKKQREKLQATIAQNEFIRNQLEGALTCSVGELEGKKNLICQLKEMSIELERSCALCLDLEHRCLALEADRSTLKEAAEKLRAEAATLRANLKEKENEALEAQCSLLDLRNKHLLMEAETNSAESRANEASEKALLLENRIAEIDKTLKEAQDGWAKAAASWEEEKQSIKQAHSKEVEELRSNTTKIKTEFEKSSYEQRLSLERVHQKLEEILLKRNLADAEWKQRLDLLEKEKKKELDDEIERRMDLERKLVLSYEKQSELRSRLEAEMTKTREIETSHKEVKTELERRVAELEAANKELENKMTSLHSQHICSDAEFPSSPKSPSFLLNRQRSNPTSDYTSDPDHHGSNGNLWFPVCGRSNNNASPDLGIESDQGRLSSLDAVPPSSPKNTHIGEIGKLELENSELRGQLLRTRKALEETFAQLNAANQRKRQVERAICRQLSKTHYILQKARTNLESSDHTTQL